MFFADVPQGDVSKLPLYKCNGLYVHCAQVEQVSAGRTQDIGTPRNILRVTLLSDVVPHLVVNEAFVEQFEVTPGDWACFMSERHKYKESPEEPFPMMFPKEVFDRAFIEIEDE